MPTPDGVPVAMISPASKVIPCDKSDTTFGISFKNNFVFEFWRSSPFTLHLISTSTGNGKADLCKITGPIAL